MFDIVLNFVGIAFGWIMLGAFLLPLAVFSENLFSKYVNYATVGQIKPKWLFSRLWDEVCLWFGPEPGPYLTKERAIGRGAVDAAVSAGGWYSAYAVFVVVHYIIATVETGAAESLLHYMVFWSFDVWIIIGKWAAPFLTVVGILIGLTVLSRKMFSFKAKVESKLSIKAED